MNSKAVYFKFGVSTHVALRMLLALSQAVNCIFWLQLVNCINIAGHLTLLNGPTVHPAVHSLYLAKANVLFEPAIFKFIFYVRNNGVIFK